MNNQNIICVSDEEREKLNNMTAKEMINHNVSDKCGYCEWFFNFKCQSDKCVVR